MTNFYLKERGSVKALPLNERIDCGITKMKKSWQLLTILCMILFSINSYSQASYNYGWEPTGLGGWTNADTGVFSRNTTGACTGSAYVRANVYYNGTNTFTSPSLGTSNAGLVTFGFSYKAVQYTGGAAATPDLIQIQAQWSNSTSGPWSTFHTINNANHVASTSCATVSATFSPGAGTLYVRFLTKAIGASADLYFYYDNISVSQGTAPTCFVPMALSGTTTTPTSANLSWTASTSLPTSGYQWEVRSSGAGGSGSTGLVDSGLTVAGVTSAVTSALSSNTSYTLYVRSNCGASDFSNWASSSLFTTPASCLTPSALVASSTSTTTANLSWTASTSSPSAGYQWEVRTSGAGGSGATGLATSGSTAAGVITATASVLTANTSYILYVRSNCGAGDFSSWIASTGFVTPCDAITAFPWTEGFETSSPTIACLRVIDGNADTYTWSVSTSNARTGAQCAAMYTDASASNNDYLVTPRLALGATAKRLTFWTRARSTGEPDEISIRVSTTGTNLADFSNVVMASMPVASTTYQKVTVDLSVFAGANIYIAFVRNAAPANGWYLYVDDVTVENTPLDLPDLVTLHSPASSSAQVGTGTVVNAQVFEAGLTDVEPGLSGQATGMIVSIGISPIGANTNPNTWSTWVTATYDATVTGVNDGYKATIGASLPVGTYYYATRASLNGGVNVYGGINSSNVGGIWDGTTFNSGVLTINPIINDECTGAVALTLGTQIVTTNVAATKSLEPVPTCGALDFATIGKDVWYSVVVPANVSRLDIETNNNSDTNITDTAIQAYRGVCGSLVSIECDDDDSADGNFSLLNLTALTPGETIYVRAWGYSGSSGTFKIKATVPSCAIETRWDGTAWSNGVPVAGIVAVINGNYSGPGFESCALDIIGTSQVTFTSGSNLIVNGLVNVASTATMTLESNANLVQTVNGTNIGNITVKRESAQLVRLDHTLWSSPVASQNLFAFSPNTLTNRFYVYNTPTDTFVTTGLTATTNFTVGKGYGIRAANSHPETPATWMGSFTGNPNNGNKSFTLATTGTGFNLVGNPYPSVIDAAAFVTANTSKINGTLYFYAHTLTMSTTGTFPAGTNYALWNATGQTAASLGTSGVPALIPNGTIQVGQGFLVKSSAVGDVVFNNAMRQASNGNQFFRMASEVQSTSDAEKHRFWLNLTNAEGTTFNQILVGYISGATQEADNLYDGIAFGNEGSALSSRLNNEDYTIQGRALPFSASDIVPLGFKAITSGNYTISLSDRDGIFSTDQNVYLKDNANGSINDIKIAPYTFVSEVGTFNNRFEVVYQTNLKVGEQIFNANSVVAYVNNSQLNIQTKGNSMKAVSVFDVRGRLIFQKSGINATDFIAQGLTSQNQVLLVQVTAENGEVATIKVIF